VMTAVNQLGLNYEDHDTLRNIRLMFIISQLAVLGMLALVRKKVMDKNDARTVIVPEELGAWAQAQRQADHASAVQEAKAAGRPAPVLPALQAVRRSYRDYDLDQVRKQFNQAALGAVITGVVHFQWGFVPPLLFQSILNPQKILMHQLFQIHVFGLSDQDASRKRPFKEENPGDSFKKLLGGKDESAPAEAEAEAEAEPEPEPARTAASSDSSAASASEDAATVKQQQKKSRRSKKAD